MPHSFISYSRRDKRLISAVYGIVRSSAGEGKVFVDSTVIAPGEDWEFRIVEELLRCDTFYVVWTGNARLSKWVRREVQIAVSLNEERGAPKIVPLQDPRVKLEHGLEKFQAVELSFLVDGRRVAVTGLLFSGMSACAGGFATIQMLPRTLAESLFVVFVWISFLFFSGLRSTHAPWGVPQPGQVHLLFGVVVLPYRATVYAFIGFVLMSLTMGLLLFGS